MMNYDKLSKQDKIEGILLISFLTVEIISHLLLHNGFVLEFAAIVIICLLILWIKNSVKRLKDVSQKKKDKHIYNILMLLLGIYGKSTSLLSFAFWLAEMPFAKELILISKVLMLVYIIVSFINKEYRNTLRGIIYKII